MTSDTKKQVVLMKGIGVSSGIAVGKAYLLERGAIEPAQYCSIDRSEAENEIERFKKAFKGIQGPASSHQEDDGGRQARQRAYTDN